jgi:hypothetical protein
LPTALESYRASLGIVERLTKMDPRDIYWQRDFAETLGAIAIVLTRQGFKQDAVANFKQGRAIIEKLRQQSPENSIFVKDLAVIDEQLAKLK